MKCKLVILIIVASIFMSSCAKNYEQKSYNEGVNIIPVPKEMSVDETKHFVLDKNTVFVVNCDSARNVAEFFAKKLRISTGYDFKVEENGEKNVIALELDANAPIVREGYNLSVCENGVSAKASSAAGLFYVMQTVMQLLPAEIESNEVVKNIEWRMPFAKISDEPRFAYRGVHLDPSRHFVDVEFIKKQIDVWAMYKINTMHWHLTDDQGWRIEIKKYPELTTVGAKRIEGEGYEYGGFYTQEQAKEIVSYAAERFITVIPELEVPGHELAAISAYPWLSCNNDTVTPRIVWGVEDIVMCPGKESTFEFLQGVIDELVEIFPSEYFHIGGDECPKVFWKKCPLCQARIKEEHLDENPDHSPEDCLQSYVVKRVEAMLAKHGRKIIGWDEILDGEINPSATVMSWRGEDGGIAAAQKGHDVIMTPYNGGMYIDYYQGDSKIEPVTIGGSSKLETTYGYNPIPDTLAKLGQGKHVRGVQCNLWAEYLYNDTLREYRYYPRALALAEVAWSQLEKKDYADFCRRLDNAFVRLDMHNITYHIPLPEQPKGSCNFVAFVDSAVLEFTTSRPVKMVYSIDGSDLTPNSKEYTEPIVLKENTMVKIASVLPSGKMSKVREITVEKQEYAPSIEVANAVEGLKMHNVAGMFLNVAELEKATGKAERDTVISKLVDIRSVANFGEPLNGYDNYASVAEGYLRIDEDGVYYFSTDNEEFWIDGQKLIDNSGEVKRFSRHDKSIALAKGLHPIKIVYLGHIIGGWPSVWNDGKVEMRKSGDEKFAKIDGRIYVVR
ncbi:MAG: family 20 glycosylhydrolase [Bacteroidales bacterium]|nr:family 20 glycosylhydrolase [Bacteroidales bacterium]